MVQEEAVSIIDGRVGRAILPMYASTHGRVDTLDSSADLEGGEVSQASTAADEGGSRE